MRTFIFLSALAPIAAFGGDATGLPANPATKQTGTITMLDPSGMSAAELLALAAAERAVRNPLSCCDWGGNCDTSHLAAASQPTPDPAESADPAAARY